jgi:hypothetical protein
VTDPADAPAFDWRVLNDLTQLATRGGAVIGVAYAMPTWTGPQRPSPDSNFEFWWLPVHDPEREEVLFGDVADTEGRVVSWAGVHQAAQWIEAEHAAAGR